MRKPNENCLEGVACPKCGHEDRFLIAANVIVQVTDDGTEDIGGDYEWSEDSYCECGQCPYAQTLKEFTIENWTPEQRAWLEEKRKEDTDDEQ